MDDVREYEFDVNGTFSFLFYEHTLCIPMWLLFGLSGQASFSYSGFLADFLNENHGDFAIRRVGVSQIFLQGEVYP